MASESSKSSGSTVGDWVPSPELLENRELLSGLVEGLSDLSAGAPAEEAAAVPDPSVEQPPAVVERPAEVSTRTVDSSHATAATPASPAAVEQSTPPGAEAVDSLLGKVAVEHEAHADSKGSNSAGTAPVESRDAVHGPTARQAAESKTAEAPAAQNGAAPTSADVSDAKAIGPAPTDRDVHEAGSGSVSDHGAGTLPGRLDRGPSPECEFECVPTHEETAQPHMMAEVTSGERSKPTTEAGTVEREMHSHEDNQHEEAKAPIERSMLSSSGGHTAGDPSWVGKQQETSKVTHSGEVKIVEQAKTQEDLVSRVSQLFDLVPNWPGVDLDAVEDAARSVAHDGKDFGADVVSVSTRDASCWVTAMAGTFVGSGIAQRELGSQTRDTAEAPISDEVERSWIAT